ncbi:MAG UNVERIFIED_CONTAM: response regulator transcription factor [Planctomycetaceae bacterium]|jgi:DNA-binding NarL/FixJ family response regulator
MDWGAPASILLVDDHPLLRAGLAARLLAEPDLKVVGEAASEAEALELLRNGLPDLAIIDISLRDSSGLDLVRQIRVRGNACKVLVISGFRESIYGERALRAGALGFLNKQETDERLLEAVRTVLKGRRFCSPILTQRLMTQALNGDQELRGVERLTDRELDVYRMIAEGYSSGVIAAKLFISTHTVDTHRENIKRKLGLKSAGELTRSAVHWQLENQ